MPSTCFVGKSNILFVGEKGEYQPVTPAVVHHDRVYPYRKKEPKGVKIYMPLYTLVGSCEMAGQIHLDSWQQLAHLLDTDEKFLPMTKVQILPEVGTGESSFDFVAVSKSHIIYVEEL